MRGDVQGSFAVDVADDASSIGDHGEATTLLRKTSTKRRRVLVRCSNLDRDGNSTVAGGFTSLKRSAVRQNSLEFYGKDIRAFRSWSAPLHVDKATDQEV